mgnify:CR=1 FL=1
MHASESVAIMAVPQAAASRNIVQKPSDREGRQSASACNSRAAKSLLLSVPGVAKRAAPSCWALHRKGPSPAMTAKMLQSASRSLMASAS